MALRCTGYTADFGGEEYSGSSLLLLLHSPQVSTSTSLGLSCTYACAIPPLVDLPGAVVFGGWRLFRLPFPADNILAIPLLLFEYPVRAWLRSLRL